MLPPFYAVNRNRHPLPVRHRNLPIPPSSAKVLLREFVARIFGVIRLPQAVSDQQLYNPHTMPSTGLLRPAAFSMVWRVFRMRMTHPTFAWPRAPVTKSRCASE